MPRVLVQEGRFILDLVIETTTFGQEELASIGAGSTLAGGSIIRSDDFQYSWNNQRADVPWSIPLLLP